MAEKKLPHDHHCGMEQSFDHMPDPDAFAAAAELFKLLSDRTRLRLFWLLCHCEECVLNLSVMMDMSSPALSHHLKLLKACGLITSRREGKKTYYALNRELLEKVSVRLREMLKEEPKNGKSPE